ncbi:uncharacterized protein KY384_005538 [Bacidia gigantensis]|uniref:uncharacterized protein n=1 Tax=Bacidia gigantensis TaxID=2732470 RepID=UPI001D04C343|nr:uncharacterized protein KY384_005538 [Bacidia gigantensis]KAG8530056.1 hypothetical protein KY384_005538 [Bacidia gigantensis]
MSAHRPITRSRSKKLRMNGGDNGALDPAYVPPPLNVRKANALVNPSKQLLDVAAIGLAVGSPKDSPLPPLPKETPHPNQFDFQFPSPIKIKGPTNNDVVQDSTKHNKSRSHRWKTFGGLFSKNHAPTRSEERPAHGTVQKMRAEEYHNNPSQGTQSGRKRAGSDKEKVMEQNNLIANGAVTQKKSLIRRASSKRKAVRRRNPNDVARADRNRSNRTSAVYGIGNNPSITRHAHVAKALGDYSLLQVEIPSVQLERYSVMFGNLLQGTPNGSRTSLAKSIPKKLEGSGVATKPLEAPPSLEELPNPHRRDGSGSSTSSKTPSFSLFPSTQTSGRGSSPARSIVNKPLPKPSPLSRSVTAPEGNVCLPPRPPFKPAMSEDTAPVLLPAPGKENIPVSKWSTSHSRENSQNSLRGRQNSVDPSNRPYGHVARQSLDNSHRPPTSHYRKSSADRPLPEPDNRQHRGALLNGYDPLSANPTTMTTSAKPSSNDQEGRDGHSKNAFMHRAFPTRKSSLKRPKARERSNTREEGTSTPQEHLGEHNRQHLPPPLVVDGGFVLPDSESDSKALETGNAAEVSIARQISISRRQKQLLVPVVAKTARQPLQPHVVDGTEGRRSELVMFEDA